MSRRSTANLKKRAQSLAVKGDDSMLELAETLSELRAMPKPPDGDRPTLHELVDLTKLSLRTICYLLKVWQMVSDLGIPRERLVHIGLDQDGHPRRELRTGSGGGRPRPRRQPTPRRSSPTR